MKNLKIVNGVVVIEFDQILQLTKILYRTHNQKSRLAKKKFAEERKKPYLEGDWVEYEKLVVRQKAEEDKLLDRIKVQACEFCQIP